MKCPICHSAQLNLVFSSKTPFNKLKVRPLPIYKAYRCFVCQHMVAEGDFSEALIRELYSIDFYSSGQQAKNSHAIGKSSPVLMNAEKRMSYLRHLKTSGRLLDVGAGRGCFVEIASHTYDSSGIESAKAAVVLAEKEGILVRHENFLETSGVSEYDILTMWDVLSCFKEPYRTVEKARELLRPEGLFVFTVPRTNSLISRLLKRFWPLFIPPMSIHYYSEASVRHLLEKSGFTLVDLRVVGKRVSLQFMVEKLLRVFGIGGLYKLVKVITPNFSIPLNLRDIMTVVAEKKGC